MPCWRVSQVRVYVFGTSRSIHSIADGHGLRQGRLVGEAHHETTPSLSKYQQGRCGYLPALSSWQNGEHVKLPRLLWRKIFKDTLQKV